jgi:hypothetical protein
LAIDSLDAAYRWIADRLRGGLTSSLIPISAGQQTPARWACSRFDARQRISLGMPTGAEALRRRVVAALLSRAESSIGGWPTATSSEPVAADFVLRLTIIRRVQWLYDGDARAVRSRDGCFLEDVSRPVERQLVVQGVISRSADAQLSAVDVLTRQLIDPNAIDEFSAWAKNACQSYQLALPVGPDAAAAAALGLLDPLPLDLAELPYGASIGVSLDGVDLPRSTTQGFDFNPVTRRLLLRGVSWGAGSRVLVGFFVGGYTLLGGDDTSDCR